MNNNILPFAGARQSQEELRDEACAWLARLDAGADPQDVERLMDWMAEDPRHVHMLLNMASMWDKALVLSELAEVFPLQDTGRGMGCERKGRRVWLAAAALAGVAVLGAALFGWTSLSTYKALHFEQVFATAVGERRQVDLPDGSALLLNTDTQISVSFAAGARNLVLDHGEVFFDVERDAGRPFRVQVGTRVVEAIGTAFTVQLSPQEGVEIIVTEGKVNYLPPVQTAGDEPAPADPARQQMAAGPRAQLVPLSAGERATVANGVLEVEKSLIPLDEIEVQLAWRVGMLVFQGDALEQVLREVSRYTTVKLEAEESIRGIQVDGIFRAGDIDGLLIAMKKNFRIESTTGADGQILLTAVR